MCQHRGFNTAGAGGTVKSPPGGGSHTSHECILWLMEIPPKSLLRFTVENFPPMRNCTRMSQDVIEETYAYMTIGVDNEIKKICHNSKTKFYMKMMSESYSGIELKFYSSHYDAGEELIIEYEGK